MKDHTKPQSGGGAGKLKSIAYIAPWRPAYLRSFTLASASIQDDMGQKKNYAGAPNLTDTSFETPGSCIVTP